VRDRADDLVRILALESVRHKFLVIGEDLGTVEPYIRETLARFGIYSYRVFFFEHTYDGQFRLPQDYPPQALVCTATHDLPTVAGFWTGQDIEARRAANLVDDVSYREQWASRTAQKQKMLDVLHRAGLLPPGYPTDASKIADLTPELHHAVVGFLAVTPAALLVVNQEDLTREPHQQNLPGSTWQYPNWGRKMRFTLEELRHHPDAVGCTRMLRHWVERSGRAALPAPGSS
jgi:4-alpha-glucanotransferase